MLAVAGGAGCRRPRGAQSPFEQHTEELLIPIALSPRTGPGRGRRTPALNTQGELMGWWWGLWGCVSPWSEP